MNSVSLYNVYHGKRNMINSFTVYGTRTFAALVKMELGLKTFPATSVMIWVLMLTFSTVSIGNELLDGMLRVFPDMSRGIPDFTPLTVGTGRNRGLPSRNLTCSSKKTSIKAGDTTMALCIEGAIPSLAVIDISGNALPARSVMLGDEYVATTM